MSEMLLVERGERILRITLNRPQARNALHPEQLQRLTAVVGEAGADPGVALVVLQGAGEKAFSAGFDIKVLAAAAGAGDPVPPSVHLHEATAAVERCPKPTLALVRGYCYGAGFDLAMACDFRIGTPDARFAVPAVRIGTVYEPRAVERIARLLGPTTAKELFVLGRELDAGRALRAGILQDVVEPSDAEEAVGGWVCPAVEVAAAHKRIVDAVAGSPDRPDGFWEPLDELRARSVAGTERRDALEAFAR